MLDIGEVFLQLLTFSRVKFFEAHIRIVQDRMHRCPEFMTHVHQERGLGMICLIGLLLGCGEFLVDKLQACPLGVQLRTRRQKLPMPALQIIVYKY